MSEPLLAEERTTHPVTGATLEPLRRRPLRQFAVFAKYDRCELHSGGLTRSGHYRCDLCGSTWDREGRSLGVTKPETRAPAKNPGKK